MGQPQRLHPPAMDAPEMKRLFSGKVTGARRAKGVGMRGVTGARLRLSGRLVSIPPNLES